MSTWKRIILPLLFVLSAYFVGLVLFGLFAPEKLRSVSNLNFHRPGYGHLLSRTTEADTLNKIDLLVLGSSHAYRGFDPRIFHRYGIEMFNLGSSSQSPVQSEWLYRHYADGMKPKRVIIETYPQLFSNDGLESTLDIISNGAGVVSTFSLAAKARDPRMVNFLLFRAFLDFTNKAAQSEPREVGSDTYIRGGFVEKNTTPYSGKVDFSAEDILINTNQLDALKAIIAHCASAEIPVILVQAPVTSAYYSSFVGTEKFDLEMKKMAPYFNYNGKLPLVDSLHFYDHHHLNQAGVEIFNRAVIEDITD